MSFFLLGDSTLFSQKQFKFTQSHNCYLQFIVISSNIDMSFYPALWTWICVECSQTCLL